MKSRYVALHLGFGLLDPAAMYVRTWACSNIFLAALLADHTSSFSVCNQFTGTRIYCGRKEAQILLVDCHVLAEYRRYMWSTDASL